jgi:GMP synthase (glutamine-hydrolysing)
MGFSPPAAEVVDPRKGDPLPEPTQFIGVVVTGSSALVSNREAWSERTASWIGGVLADDVPFLGICYDHQLLAHGQGGAVGLNPRGREIGTIEVTLTKEGKSDALFGKLPSPLTVQATHVESVLTLPPGARRLASNDHDPNQAFTLGECAWSVQFHPEFDAEAIAEFVAARADLIRKEGENPNAIASAVKDSDHGLKILKGFADECLKRGGERDNLDPVFP